MGIFIKGLRKCSDDQFNFHLSNGEILNYRKSVSNRDNYYLTNTHGPNNSLFSKLGFTTLSKNAFVSKIVGYEAKCSWPEVKSEKDLMRVINALCAYNNPEYTIKEDFIVEDYPILPSEILSFYRESNRVVMFEEIGTKYNLHNRKDGTSTYWWYNVKGNNDHIFDMLKISDKNKWVENILGYKIQYGVSSGDFPESKTKEDAYKVMNAPIAEYIKQFQPKTTTKTTSYEIKLCRKKS